MGPKIRKYIMSIDLFASVTMVLLLMEKLLIISIMTGWIIGCVIFSL